MGSCTNKQLTQRDNNNGSNSNYNNNNSNLYKSSLLHLNHIYGILKHPRQPKSLILNHSPLKSSQFLFNKFNNSDGSPQQINLGFMLNSLKVNIISKQLSLKYIITNKTNIWIIYGGLQKISQTGLTMEIKHYRQMKLLTIQKPNNLNNLNPQQQTSIIKFQQKQKQKLCDNFLIVFQSLSSQQRPIKQTIIMIYRYQLILEQKQYSLITQIFQWSSLSFRINDIYGAQNLFKCNNENQLCSICLTSISSCILLPCRHMCVCQICLDQVQKTKPRCPLCRKQYYSVVKYKSEGLGK